MSYYPDPETLAANPPETWRVEKRAERLWVLCVDGGDYYVQSFSTKREALAERDDPNSYTRRMVEQERRWYEGVNPAGWKSWEECKAEQERCAKRYAERLRFSDSLAAAGSTSPASTPAPKVRATGKPEYKQDQWP